jgi:putative DNA primase/helicase
MADREINETMATAEGYEESLEATVVRLATLPEIEYAARWRKQEAKRLDVPVSLLDKEVKAAREPGQDENDLGLFEPEPWPEEVDGDDLLSRITAAICRYVVMPDYLAQVVALWVIHAHCFENWQCTPRLAVGAPDMGCGKSTLLDVLASLVPRAVKTENLSTAVMFRVVDKYRPTLLVDEVDTFLRDNDELRGALNAGHRKGGQVFRCEGDDNRLKGFKTFAPVATAGIGRLPGTLADRSIPIILHKRKTDEPVTDFRDDRADHLRDLARQVARWVGDHQISLSSAEPTMPPGVHNRTADNWRPLLTVADAAGGEWPDQAREIATRLTRSQGEETSYRIMALADIKAIFDQRGGDSLPSTTVCADLAEMEDRPWPEYRKGKPITPRQLASLLVPFGITPGTIRTDTGTPKGYTRTKFEDAFKRYVPTPPILSATTPQAMDTAGFGDFPSATKDQVVADRNGQKSRVSAACGVVAAKTGGCGDNTLFEGDLEEREAIMAIDGEAAICAHCGELVGLDEEHVPYNGDRKLHGRCYDAFFGFERQARPQG